MPAADGSLQARDRTKALALVPVSRETQARLVIYVDLLRRWQTIKNLVAPSTLDQVWTRHIADSAQLTDVVPEARRWVDLGSGAGFPGLVIALRLAETAGAEVHLIESDHRKCAFLRAVIRETGAPAIVHADRIEAVLEGFQPEVHAVTARALAPLPLLVAYAHALLMRGAVGVFPKGRAMERELTASPALRNVRLDEVSSVTDPQARIIVVRALGAPLDSATA